jgi:hypothetical protein
MFANLRCIHPDGIEKAAIKIKCGEFEYRYISTAHLAAHYLETKPLPEYTAPEKFPNCCPLHFNIYKNAQELIEELPNCCDSHKKLTGQRWFSKHDYHTLPMKLMNTLSHTEFHIHNRIDSDNWYKDITDYIQYCIESFGLLPDGFGSPIGLHLYLQNLKDHIRRVSHVDEAKKQRLIRFIDSPASNNEPKSLNELNILIETYSKWMKIFPFDLSLFSHLKERFRKNVPILKGETISNPYSGLSHTKLKTKKELIEFLVGVTEKIVSEVNSLALYEKNLLTDAEKLKLEIINKNRRLELEEITNKYVDERSKYLKVVRSWLDGEKRYLHEISPFIKDRSANGLANTQADPVNYELELCKLTESENKFWKGLPMRVVIDHFRVFASKKSRNGKPFLTYQQLYDFMQRGFLGKEKIRKQKFNLSNGEKGFIIKRFYELFEISVSQYSEVNRKYKYIQLITDCFDNWDKGSIDAFFKPNKTKESWN